MLQARLCWLPLGLLALSAFAHRERLCAWTLASPTVRQVRMLLLCPLVRAKPRTWPQGEPDTADYRKGRALEAALQPRCARLQPRRSRRAPEPPDA